MAAPGWPGSWNTRIKVTSVELACPAHVIRPSLWLVLPCNLHVYKSMRLNLLNPRVLKLTVTHPVCEWRCCTLPVLRFERERMQLAYEIVLFNQILRNHLLSEHQQWNYASFKVKIKRLTSVSSNKFIKLQKYFICGHSSHVIPLIETIPYLSHARSRPVPMQVFWDRKSGIKYLASKASLWHAFYLVRVVRVADICVAWLVYLTCLRSHILRAYCNFESKQAISKTLFSFRRKFFHAYWALHVNDGFEVYRIKLISIMTTDDPDIIRFRRSEIWGIKSLAWLRVTF